MGRCAEAIDPIEAWHWFGSTWVHMDWTKQTCIFFLGGIYHIFTC